MTSWVLYGWGKGALALAAALCCWALPASPAVAAPTGSIVGTATAVDTQLGLEGVEVCASRYVESEDEEEEGERVERCATTDPTGAYAIEELDEGDYQVRFRPLAQPYFAGSFEESFGVGSGVTEVEIELEPAAMITGAVIAGGQPVEEGRVCAWRLPEIEKGLCGETRADGGYAIRFATPGEFQVEFQSVGPYATRFFDEKQHAREADPVAATMGAVHPGVDASLEVGGLVRGTVRSSSGWPLREILVCAVEASSGALEACDETGVFGQYAVGPLATGGYKIGFSVALGREFFGDERFLGENDGFETRFYDEQTSLSAASTIGISAPGSVSGIDARLFESEPSTAVPPPVVTVVPAPRQARKPAPLRCRRGFKKKLVRGKERCVKVRKRRQKR